MREILFRGKRIGNGEWVGGKGFLQESSTCWLYGKLEREQDWFDDWVKVDPKTVGQYTGLKAHGKRIFEGDIISTDIKRPYNIVEFRDGCFMFNCNDGGKDYYDIMLPILDEPQTQYEYGEVIGNIHDNPELLEDA